MLLFIKVVSLLLIVGLSSLIGNVISRRFKTRVKVLEDIGVALDMFETRVKYTYDTVADNFKFIAQNMSTDASIIFEDTANKINENNNISAGDAFRETVDSEAVFLELDKEDIEVLKGLGASLGQTDLEGQVKNIILIKSLLAKRLEEAQNYKDKNYKLAKNMGIFAGLVIMLILL